MKDENCKDDLTVSMEPEYLLRDDLDTEFVWNDEGFIITLKGKPGSADLQWLWDNKRAAFEKEYPVRPIKLKNMDGKPYAILVMTYDISTTDLNNLDPKDKWSCEESVFGGVGRFEGIVGSFLGEYNEMKNAVKTA